MARSSFVLPLVTGLPASPGLASGAIATSPEAALAAAADGLPTILVRAETSPEDVHGMAAAAGILTSRGGLASHAAVVARGWGIPAVVGATGLEVSEGEVVVGERTCAPATSSRSTGARAKSSRARSPARPKSCPRPGRCSAGRHELGIDIAAETGSQEPRRAPTVGAETQSARKVTPDECLRVIAIKGFALLPGVADAVLAARRRSSRSSTSWRSTGSWRARAGAFRLTDAGPSERQRCSRPTGTAWGTVRPSRRSTRSLSSTTE